MVKVDNLKNSPELKVESTDSLREDITLGIDKKLEDKERMIDEIEPPRMDEYRALVRAMADMQSFERSFEDDGLRDSLDSIETNEEKRELINDTRDALMDFDLTGLEATYGVERNDEGDYTQVEVIQEDQLEVNLNEWDSNIEEYLHELDQIEEEYLSDVEEEFRAAAAQATRDVERTARSSSRTSSPSSGAAAPTGNGASPPPETTSVGIFARLNASFARIGEQFSQMQDRVSQMFEDAVDSIFGGTPRERGRDYDPTMMESRPIDIDPSLIGSAYELSDQEVAHLSPQERGYAELIAAYAGLPPSRVEALGSYSSASSLSRVELYQYVSEMAEACAVYDIPPEMGLPLMVANGIIESGLDPMSDIDDDGDSHKGLYQYKTTYWESTFAGIRPQLIENGVIPDNSSFDVMGSLYNSRVQSYAIAEGFVDHLGDLGGDWSSYDERTICRDLYLIHNMGSGHRWMIRYLNGEISTDQLLDMYANRDGDRATLPTGGTVNFDDWALRKALELPDNQAERDRFLQDSRIPEGYGRTFANQTWNKAQNHFNRVREILYGRHS